MINKHRFFYKIGFITLSIHLLVLGLSSISRVNLRASLTLDWDASATPNVTYIIYEADEPQGDFHVVTNEGTLNGTSWEKTLTNENRKFYRVTAGLY